MIEKNKLITLIFDEDKQGILDYLDDYNVYSISEIAQDFDVKQIIFLLKVLPKNISGDLFDSFEDELQSEIIVEIPHEDIEDVFEHLYTDDIVEILQTLPNQEVRNILEHTSTQVQEDITNLLNYEAETSGSIMTIDFIELNAHDTFANALDKVKGQSKVAEVVTDCYIIDKEKHLIGKIKLKDLIFGESDEVVQDKMEQHVVSVNVDLDQEEVLDKMKKYDLHVIPVVNKNEQLLGIITIDDIIDIMEEEVTHDVHAMAGVSKVEDSYINTSIVDMAKARIPWLLIIMLTAFLTEIVLNYYSVELNALPVLAAFIPMTMGTAGNAAHQATVMVVRAIAVDGLDINDSLKVLRKEVSVSFYLVLAMALAIMLRLIAFPPHLAMDVMISITAATVISIFLGNIVGGLLPLVALKFNQDPAAMAGPVVTNIMDIASLIIYFICASFIL